MAGLYVFPLFPKEYKMILTQGEIVVGELEYFGSSLRKLLGVELRTEDMF